MSADGSQLLWYFNKLRAYDTTTGKTLRTYDDELDVGYHRPALSRDGEPIGTAKWEKDQLLLNTTLIPDDVCTALEKKIQERMDANWDED